MSETKVSRRNGVIAHDANSKTKGLTREISLPPEVLSLLKSMGIAIPDNVKEITTETVVDEKARTITIPATMNKREASVELEKQYVAEEQIVAQVADFPEWQWKDVLIAIKNVTEELFGWMNAKATWFSQPTEIDVVVDIVNGQTITEKAYIGKYQITTWDGSDVDLGINGGGVVHLSIKAKRKHAKEVTEYFNLIRVYLKEHSIYRGKSIVVTASDRGGVDFELMENKGSDKIVLNEDEKHVIDTFIIDSLGEPHKRTYLFTGDYGNGKTEEAMRVGRIAVSRGISFFYLKDSKLFDNVLNMLKQYSPAVLFVEDIDEITGSEERDDRMNHILNTLDGVQTKGNPLTTIFTTNHVNRINSALRRPGRIDLIVPFNNPNKDTVAKIYAAYFETFNGYAALDMPRIVERTPHAQGAVIAEIAKRVQKLYSKKETITTEQVLACVVSMEYHVQIMAETPTTVTKEKLFYDTFVGMVASGSQADPEALDTIDAITRSTLSIAQNIDRKLK